MNLSRWPLGAILAWFMTCPLAVAADQIVLCQSPKQDDITVRYNDAEFEGRQLNCIGGEFVADVSSCAPNGGYALASPTGAPIIIDIVDDWRDYGDHVGGVTAHWLSPDYIYFAAGHMGPGGYHEHWSVKVSRLTGEGRLTLISEDRTETTFEYQCRAAEQLF